MKAMLLRRIAPIDSSPLELVDLPTPEPAPGEVRIRVRCCAICRTDLHVIEGDLPQQKLPIVPGHQIVGTIDKLGPPLAASHQPLAVSQPLQVGRRVGVAWLRHTCGECGFCTKGQENLCQSAQFTGYHADGGYAEYAVAPADFVYELPEAFGDVESGAALTSSRNVLARSLGRTGYRRVLESRPHLCLPTTIVALDSRLKAGFVWRREDRRYPQTQAQPDDPSHRIGVLARALETVVVVELGIAGKPYRSPVFDQRIDHGFRTHRPDRPRRWQPAMQRNSRQNSRLWSTTNCQTLDRIEAVQLGLRGCDQGRIPASRRWRPTNPPPTIQGATTL